MKLIIERTSQTIQRSRIGEPKTKSEISDDEAPNSPESLSDMMSNKSSRLAKFEKELKVNRHCSQFTGLEKRQNFPREEKKEHRKCQRR